MRLAISNIAWDIEEDQPVAKLLHKHRVDAIDIAPSKYFADPVIASESEILRVKNWWQDKGIEITGMQSLLFGTSGLNLFGTNESKLAMLDYLGSICRIGRILGATRLVFGSPKNRDKTGLSDEDASNIAVDFFKLLGDRASQEGVTICLEPNPICYGANFMTTTAETAQIVHATNHSAIKMQLDVGAIKINGEDVESTVSRYAGIVGHVHASEPDLVPLGDKETRHDLVAESLSRHMPHAIVCIEMLATKKEPHIQSIDRAISNASQAYRCSVQRSSV